jgi:hypothetical protein
MAQIIKHRRGSLEALSAVTASLIIASGSSNLSVSNGSSIVFAVPENGQVQAVNRFLIGDNAPNVFSAGTYNGMLKGVPYYASGSATLYLLGEGSNDVPNLIGNIQPFSQSVDSRLDAVESQIGGGGGGSLSSRVVGLESFTGSYATTGSNTFVASQTIQGNVVLANGGQIQIHSNTEATLFGMYDGSAIQGAYFQLWGNNHASTTQRGTAEFVYDTRNNGGEFRVVSFDGSNFVKRFIVNRDGNTNVTGSLFVSGEISGSTLNGIGNVAAFSQSVDSRLDAIENTNATQATTGSNIFYGTQTITGSLFITDNLVVQGSSSLQNITASAVDIGTNIVTLNTAAPSVRFGGISVQDSGSFAGVSGSLIWDSFKNHWLYVQPSGSNEGYNSAILIAGPMNTGTIGDEAGITSGSIQVALGENHIGDSIITQNVGATKITIAGGLDVNGAISASSITGIGNVAVFSQSVDSRLDTIETSLGGGGSIGARVSALEVFSGSQEQKDIIISAYTASMNAFTASQLQKDSTLQTYTASLDLTIARLKESTASLNLYTQSQNAKNSTLALYTASVDSKFEAVAASSASLNSFSASALTRFTRIEESTASINLFTQSANNRLTTLEGAGTIQGVGTGNTVTFAALSTTHDLTVGGDLVVQGNTVTLNTNTLVVEDKTIQLASGSTNAATANGAGIEVLGANATFTYDSTPNAWTANIPISASAVTASVNVPGFGSSKRLAFRTTNGNLDFITAPTTAGDIAQWDGTNFVMSNVIDGGTF